MKWSWKIARVAGIDLSIHTTFFLLIAWAAVSYWIADRRVAAVVEGVLFLLALFGSVVLHELGHALTARRYGIRTSEIMLLPIGGVAKLERMPEKPFQELRVALAGPLVNLVLAGVLFGGLYLAGALEPINGLTLTEGNFFERLMVTNLYLALFNLIPAFPMDGGRVIRALLATRMEYTRATQVAASLGQGIAFLMGLAGLFGNPMLLFIALFVWIGASQEASMVQVKSALGGIPVSRAMLTDYQVLAPTDSLGKAVQYVLSGIQHDFPVVADGHVVGILTRDKLIKALSEYNESTFVSYVMVKEFQTVDPAQMLEGVSAKLQEVRQSIFPVVQQGALVGLITLENIGEFLMIQRAIELRKISRLS